MRKTLREMEGVRYDWWMGVAYREFMTETVVLYPLPFNFFARWWRDFCFWIHTVGDSGYRSRVEKQAFMRGRDASDEMWKRYRDDRFMQRELQERINTRVIEQVEKIVSLMGKHESSQK